MQNRQSITKSSRSVKSSPSIKPTLFAAVESLSSIRTSSRNKASRDRNNSSSIGSITNSGRQNTQQQTNRGNSSSNLQHVLTKKYRTNKKVEAAIVRMGRQGRTDEALQLYHAMWKLDGLRQQHRVTQQRQQKQQQQKMNDQMENDNNKNSQEEELSQEMIQFLTTKSKLRPTTRLMNSAIDACARSQPLQARQSVAFGIFQTATSPKNADGTKKPGGALSPNVFTFGSLLACCARNGDVDTSLELLEVLERGEQYPDVALNEVIYSTVISACERAEVPNVKLALKVLHRGIATLTLLSNSTSTAASSKKSKAIGSMGVVGYNAAISTMARAGQWKMAVQLLCEMIVHSRSSPAGSLSDPNFSRLESIRCEGEVGGTDGDEIASSRTPLIRNANDASIILPTPDEVTFGTVLAACERSGKWEELLHVAEAANEYGVKLDGIALTSVLHSCQQLGMADEALEYLELMKRLGDEGSDGSAGCNTAQMTNGRQRKGAKQPLCGPDGVAYHLTISACARSPGGHRWRDGIHLLNEMWEKASEPNSTSCRPDVVTYTAAIAGCSEAG